MNEQDVPFSYNIGVRSPNFGEARDFINAHIDAREVTPVSAGGKTENMLTFQPIGRSALFGAQWSEKTHIQSKPQTTFHAILVLSGNIHCKVLNTDIPKDSLALIAPGQHADLVWEKTTKAVVINLSREVLVSHFGIPDLKHLRQESIVIPGIHKDAQLLRNGIECLARQHDICLGKIDLAIQNHWEALLLAQLSNQLRHPDADNLSILPSRIRLTSDWILANIQEPMSVADLLRISGAGRRSLEAGFRTYLNTTPAKFILYHKLKGVRDLLRKNPDISIGDAAFSYGFNHLSHFSRQYQKTFGELPSETPRQFHISRSMLHKKARPHSI